MKKKKFSKKLILGKVDIVDLDRVKAGSWATYLGTAAICCTNIGGTCDWLCDDYQSGTN